MVDNPKLIEVAQVDNNLVKFGIVINEIGV